MQTGRFLFPCARGGRVLSRLRERVMAKRTAIEPRSPRSHLPDTAPLVRVIAMPADANPNGDIFGGWLLAQMDLAGGNLAGRRARGRCATVAVDAMVFHEPVFVGDEVSCYGELLRIGRSSMTIRVEAWRRSLHAEEVRKVTEGVFTYVAIDTDRQPRPVPAEAPPPPAAGPGQQPQR
jgi:acyl-CoA thioesterase YciA